MSAAGARIGKLFARFAADAKGVAAIEFAFIAPVLMLLYLGASDVRFAVTLQRKVSQVASDVSDLVTRESDVTKADLDGMFRIADAILLPYDRSTLHLQLTGVQENGTKDPTILWSYSNDGSPEPSVAAIKALGQFSASKNSFVVVTQASHPYQPLGGMVISNPFTLRALAINRTRRSDQVTCGDC